LIEAARAGEAGRGFNVVADEIVKLAVNSSKAAQEVVGAMQEINDVTLEASTCSKEVFDSIKELSEKSINLNNLVSRFIVSS